MLRNISYLINPVKKISLQDVLNKIEKRQLFTSTAQFNTNEEKTQAKKDISKAMKAYLERAREHDDFMKKENQEYQIGKRHLANMMGENPETFTQDDVDAAIQYLFPSGLYEKTARPLMKPPEEVFPQRKAAEFNETGRPHNFMFYTGKANLFGLLYDIVEHINDLIKFEEAMIRKNIKPDPTMAIELSGYQWLDKVSLEQKLVENLGDKDYENFTSAMERLCSLPYSYKVQDFIMQYRKPLMSQTKTYDAPEPQYDENGRAFITTYECLRKRARGDVTLKKPGTGKITINGQDISYFENIQDREQGLQRAAPSDHKIYFLSENLKKNALNCTQNRPKRELI